MRVALVIVGIFLLSANFAFAAENDFRERILHGKVLEVLDEEVREIPGTGTRTSIVALLV